MQTTEIHHLVEEARGGQFPQVVCRMKSGWVILSKFQFLRGYCLLLPDPVVPSLNDLNLEQRKQFLLDMTAIGDALLALTPAWRINYEILGNKEPALHAHIFPRYRDEPADKAQKPVWFYDFAKGTPLDLQRDGELLRKIRQYLQNQ